ncbi:MAG: YeeE/YedE family protein [Bradyrhizobiaceae bacterium]|nr:YeeE/YedE family protein [Bradyrhizobiaceae bacterium]
MTPAALSLWAGFAIGLAFGAAGQVSGFCLNRGLRGLWVTGDGTKIRAFALALAAAIVGTQILDGAGAVDLRQSIYVGTSFSWLLLPVGGALFGYGMIACNGCGARALVLLGQGNLRSFVVLVCLGIAAYVTLTGLLAPLRAQAAGFTGTAIAEGPQSLPYLLARSAGANVTRFVTAIVLAGLLAWFAFAHKPFRDSRKDVAGGTIIGLLIPAGWLATGWIGNDDFDPVPLASLTFIAPIGETIQYAMIATGAKPGFGVAVVSGVFIGSLAAALSTGAWHLEGFPSAGRMARYMGGGALMGVGGALALGCSIGQGLTGLSTLAFGSFLAAGGILLGARLALRGPLALPAL